jgi:gamma-glutamylcyclotransferase (GGCT)/AIG2-like uncharacterized protein YtfP
MSENHKIFVYGTLKKEYGNPDVHKRYLGNAVWLGRCCIPGVMVHLGYYPGLVDDKDCRVTGEVYEVSPVMIQSMDAYEGCPHNYTRRTVDTPFGKAWCYFKNHVGLLGDAIVCVDRGLWLGGARDKAPYRQVRDFYVNKRWQQPEYRNMKDQPITTMIPESHQPYVQMGIWNDEKRCFEFPDGTTHVPPGANIVMKDNKMVAIPSEPKPEVVPEASKEEVYNRRALWVEMML